MGDKYGNGRIFEAMAAQQPQLMGPINDIQLIALIASKRTDVDESDAVSWAKRILVESIKQSRSLQAEIHAAMTNGA